MKSRKKSEKIRNLQIEVNSKNILQSRKQIPPNWENSFFAKQKVLKLRKKVKSNAKIFAAMKFEPGWL